MERVKQIDIIIPLYNQKKELIRCLSSIALQSVVDLCEVTIIDDNSDEDYQDVISFFQNIFTISYIKISNNKGPGYVRQLGINITKNPFLIFIDSDDIFENSYSIEFLYGLIISNKQPSAVFSSFVEECSNNRKVVHSKDNTWLFGKMYSRDFLKRNKIEFLDSRANEDKGFNCQVILSSKKENESKIYYIDRITYCWKWNSNSITRKDNFSYKKIDLFGFVENTLFALKKAKGNNVPLNAIQEQSTLTMIYLYYRFLENMKTKDYSEQDFVSFSKNFYELSYKIDGIKQKSDKLEIFIQSQGKNFLNRKILNETDIKKFSFQDFINYLK